MLQFNQTKHANIQTTKTLYDARMINTGFLMYTFRSPSSAIYIPNFQKFIYTEFYITCISKKLRIVYIVVRVLFIHSLPYYIKYIYIDIYIIFV